jgi:hypothetical protein
MTDLFTCSTDLVQHQIYKYIQPQVDLLLNQEYFERRTMDFANNSRLPNQNEDPQVSFMTPEIFATIYHNYFPNDAILDVFSPSDEIREYIATDTWHLLSENHIPSFCKNQQCTQWRQQQNQRFKCLQDIPEDYFHMEDTNDLLGRRYDFKWIHTTPDDSIIYTRAFYNDMLLVLREKMADATDNHELIYNFYDEVHTNYY